MNKPDRNFDFIIAGAGSAGLSLAWRIINTKELAHKSILILDRGLNPQNDKTWCFWYNGTPPFSETITKQWKKVRIGLNDSIIEEQLIEYPYYCIRSGDFRRSLIDKLKKHSRISFLETGIENIEGNEEMGFVNTEGGTYSGQMVFQSCFKPSYKVDPDYSLIQHFLGWEIETDKYNFDSNCFTLMDFDRSYKEGLGFMYILPWSNNRALFEYTVFSKEKEPPRLYEEKIELYLYNRYRLKLLDYRIERTEYGSIPMEDGLISPLYAPNVYNIGTSAGVTKPSTGYTFQRIQNHTSKIVDSLVATGTPGSNTLSPLRHRWYDLWLLQILHDYPEDAYKLFHDLFNKNSPDEVFRFLGEDTSFLQDLKIMSSVPWWPFLRAIGKTSRQMALLGKAVG